MSTAVLVALGAGAASALLYLSVLFGGIGALILGYLALLPLFLVGLWAGATATVLASIAGAAMVLAVGGGVVGLVGYAVTGAIPAVFVVRQALLARPAEAGGLEWYPPGRLLTGLTSLGLAGFAIAFLAMLGEPGGLEGVVRESLATMGRLVVPEGTPAPTAEDFWMAPALPGIVAVSWMMMTIINATLAQGLLMRFGRNRRPAMRLAELELPMWLGPVYAGALAAAVLLPGTAGFVGLSAAIVLSLPFGFAGLAVIHAFARRQRAKVALLVGFYLFLFLFGWPVVLLIGLGVIEQWMGLRRRWSEAEPRQEDE